MSATNRGAERRPDDAYYTPSWCVHRLLEAVDLPSGRWLEPACGTGAIVRAVNEVMTGDRRPSWTAIDIRPEAIQEVPVSVRHSLMVDDFLTIVAPPADVVITNPPYSLAQAFIQRSFGLVPGAFVVMLLRLNFAASATRTWLMRKHPPDIYVLPNRPSFVNGRTDATEYAWFVWPPNKFRKAGSFQVLASTPATERIQSRRQP